MFLFTYSIYLIECHFHHLKQMLTSFLLEVKHKCSYEGTNEKQSSIDMFKTWYYIKLNKEPCMEQKEINKWNTQN